MKNKIISETVVFAKRFPSFASSTTIKQAKAPALVICTSGAAGHFFKKKCDLPFLSQTISYIPLNVIKALGLSKYPIPKLQP